MLHAYVHKPFVSRIASFTLLFTFGLGQAAAGGTASKGGGTGNESQQINNAQGYPCTQPCNQDDEQSVDKAIQTIKDRSQYGEDANILPRQTILNMLSSICAQDDKWSCCFNSGTRVMRSCDKCWMDLKGAYSKCPKTISHSVGPFKFEVQHLS